jgi:hypothetical protein
MDTVQQAATTCGHTPSTTSISIIAPSHNRTAVETSDEKSTCPGVSMRLIRYFFSSTLDRRSDEMQHCIDLRTTFLVYECHCTRFHCNASGLFRFQTIHQTQLMIIVNRCALKQVYRSLYVLFQLNALK